MSGGEYVRGNICPGGMTGSRQDCRQSLSDDATTTSSRRRKRRLPPSPTRHRGRAATNVRTRLPATTEEFARRGWSRSPK